MFSHDISCSVWLCRSKKKPLLHGLQAAVAFISIYSFLSYHIPLHCLILLEPSLKLSAEVIFSRPHACHLSAVVSTWSANWIISFHCPKFWHNSALSMWTQVLQVGWTSHLHHVLVQYSLISFKNPQEQISWTQMRSAHAVRANYPTYPEA